MAGQFGAARIVIEGHTDSSMKDRVPESSVQELSANRANSVKEAILKKFPTLQPNQFTVQGNPGNSVSVTPVSGFIGDIWVLVGATDDASNPLNRRFAYQYFKVQVTA